MRTAEWGAEAVTTDAEGRFAIEGLLAGDRVTILAVSAEVTLFGAEQVVPEWELEPGIVLTRPVALTFCLVAPDGRGLADRRVSVSAESLANVNVFPVQAETTTDAEGMGRIEALVAGLRYDIVVWAAEGRGGRIVHSFDLEPGEDLDLGPIEVPGAGGSVMA